MCWEGSGVERGFFRVTGEGQGVVFNRFICFLLPFFLWGLVGGSWALALLDDFFKVFSGEGFSSFSTGWNLAAVGAVVSGYVAAIVTAAVVWEAFLCSCEEGSAVVVRLLIFGAGCFEVVDLLKEFHEGHLMIEAQKITDKCSDVRDVCHTSVVFQAEGEVVLQVTVVLGCVGTCEESLAHLGGGFLSIPFECFPVDLRFPTGYINPDQEEFVKIL